MTYYRFARIAALATVAAGSVALASCSILEPEETGLTPDEEIVVTSSEAPSFESKEVANKDVTSNLADPVEDEGLGVTFIFQGVYSDDVQGTVVTTEITNNNDVPLPPDALANPTLRLSDGSEVALLDYDPAVNTTVNPPGLDYPLGVGASTNLQYRFDTPVGNMWDAEFSLGNVTWKGNLNL